MQTREFDWSPLFETLPPFFHKYFTPMTTETLCALDNLGYNRLMIYLKHARKIEHEIVQKMVEIGNSPTHLAQDPVNAFTLSVL